MAAEQTHYQKLVQAKDVPVLLLLRAIKDNEPSWSLIWDLADLPEMERFPFKVVRAKLQQMINSDLIDGCCCGCRGDFRLKPAGVDLLTRTPPVSAASSRQT